MFGEAPFGLLVAPNWKRDKNDLVLDIQRRFEERNVIAGSKRAVLWPQMTTAFDHRPVASPETPSVLLL